MATKPTPSYNTVKAWAKTRPVEELHCRAKGRHNFENVERVIIRSKPGGYGGYYFITDECTICKMPKWSEWDYLGNEMWSQTGYTRKKGYLSTVGRITGSARAAVRAVELEHYTIPVSVIDRPPHARDYVPIPAKVQRSA